MKHAGKLLLIRERYAWMGKHSGYDQLFEMIESDWSDPVDSVWRTRSALQNLTYAPLALLSFPKTPFYNGDSMAAELRALAAARQERSRLIHICFIENNLRLLARPWARAGAHCVGTAHQPAGWWRNQHTHPELVGSLDALIVMSSELQAYFEDYLPGRVHLILHGADTDFFCPATEADPSTQGPPRCVFSGVWLRDLACLEQVIDRVLALNSEILFDMVVPTDRRGPPELHRIARHDRVEWHANLPDTGLRDLYRRSSMLLLPLLDSGANTALVESIACGLPVVTTDVGGARDYTEPSFADVLPPGDIDGMVEAVLRLADDWKERQRRSLAARAFAERVLPWQVAADKTTTLYRDVLC